MIANVITHEELSDILTRELEPIKKALAEIQKPEPPVEYLSVNETAELVGVTPFTIRSYTKKGILTRYRIGTRIRYKRSEVMNAIEKINNPKIK